MAFLNETGLATFLAYVKAWARATFASKTDTQTIEGSTTFSQPIVGTVQLGTASRAVVTDSSKNAVVSTVTATELGRLSGVTSAVQTQLNGKMPAAPVSIELRPASNASNGGFIDFHYNNSSADFTSRIIESTSGRISVVAGLDVYRSVPDVKLRYSQFARGTAPDADSYSLALNLTDATGTVTFGGIHHRYSQDKTNSLSLRAYKGTDSSSTYSDLVIGYDSSGNVYTKTPTPASTDDSTKIANTTWCRNATGSFAGGSMNVASTGALELKGTAANKLRFIYGNYGVIFRVDETSFYILLTANQDPTGTFTDARPIRISLSTGTVYINGTAASSDERIKTKIKNIPDAVLDAWDGVRWGEFKFLDSVAVKGESARKHAGVVAQEIKRVFECKNIDICEYGILCHDEPDEEDGKGSDMWYVRYAEALCMEAAYQRRKNKSLETEIANLKARIDLLEEKLYGKQFMQD